MRQSIDNLHDSITEDVLRQKPQRIVVDVIDPSPGVFGGEPMEGLVTVVYECHCEWANGCQDDHPEHRRANSGHTHHALYGPHDERTDKKIERYTCYAD